MSEMKVASQGPACEMKFCALDLKEVTLDGDFEGYASLFNREDLSRDVILPGAFRSSLRQRGAGGIKMLFQHDPGQPIGIWRTIYEDARGLFAKGRIMTELARGREVLTMMRTGAIDGLSIGLRTIDGMRDRRSGVRRLKTVDLWEISIVTFPMLPDARVSSLKTSPFSETVIPHRQIRQQIARNAENHTGWASQVSAQITEAARLLRQSNFLERTKR